jgi:hypothetical protein
MTSVLARVVFVEPTSRSTPVEATAPACQLDSASTGAKPSIAAAPRVLRVLEGAAPSLQSDRHPIA